MSESKISEWGFRIETSYDEERGRAYWGGRHYKRAADGSWIEVSVHQPDADGIRRLGRGTRLLGAPIRMPPLPLDTEPED